MIYAGFALGKADALTIDAVGIKDGSDPPSR
jgi:hypothetical protein